MGELTTSKRKKKIMTMLVSNEKIFKLIDNKDISFEYCDDLINKNVFPHIKVNFTSQETETYIGIKIDYPSICNNEIYKNYRLTVMILSNNSHLKTHTGESRTDLLGEEIIKVFNWREDLGFRVELISDTEDPFDTNFYYRRLIFKSIASNSMNGGIKNNAR